MHGHHVLGTKKTFAAFKRLQRDCHWGSAEVIGCMESSNWMKGSTIGTPNEGNEGRGNRHITEDSKYPKFRKAVTTMKK